MPVVALAVATDTPSTYAVTVTEPVAPEPDVRLHTNAKWCHTLGTYALAFDETET
jgi:hypothetical protein